MLFCAIFCATSVSAYASKKNKSRCGSILTSGALNSPTIRKFAHKGESLENAELRLAVQWFLFHNGTHLVNTEHSQLWAKWAGGDVSPEILSEAEAHYSIFEEIRKSALEDSNSILWRLQLQNKPQVVSIESIATKKRPFISSVAFVRKLLEKESGERLRFLALAIRELPALSLDEVLTIVASFRSADEQVSAFEMLCDKLIAPLHTFEIENYFSQFEEVDSLVVAEILHQAIVLEQDYLRLIERSPESEVVLQKFVQKGLLSLGFGVPETQAEKNSDTQQKRRDATVIPLFKNSQTIERSPE